MEPSLRVHIAPVGYHFRRVTEPLIRMRADKVYLVSYRPDDNASEFFGRIKKHLSQSYKHILIEERFTDLWDLYACLGVFGEIIRKELGNQVFVNVSTGTKVTAIGGMLSCMFWGATPYYARVAYAQAEPAKIPATEQVDDPDLLPVYDVRKPRPEFLLVLRQLAKHGGKMRKAQLIQALVEARVIAVRDESKAELSRAAKHSQLRAILDPMRSEWKYIEIEARGRRSEVSLTDEGN